MATEFTNANFESDHVGRQVNNNQIYNNTKITGVRNGKGTNAREYWKTMSLEMVHFIFTKCYPGNKHFHSHHQQQNKDIHIKH